MGGGVQNDGPVITVVSKNLDAIVNDETKDVMLEVRPNAKRLLQLCV